MLILKYIIIRNLKSVFIALSIFFSIFFLFSLISYLGGDLLFDDVVTISLLNAAQIIFYIPSFVYIFTIYIFWRQLNLTNELSTIVQYLPKISLIFYSIILILFVAFIETNKDQIIAKIEEFKQKILIKEINNGSFKTYVSEKKGNKEFLIFKKEDINSTTYNTGTIVTISNGKIQKAFFDKNIQIDQDRLLLQNPYYFDGNTISLLDEKKILIKDANLNKFLNSDYDYFLDKDLEDNKGSNLYQYIFLVFSNIAIYLLFLKNTSYSKNDNVILIILSSILLIIYSYLIFGINLFQFQIAFFLLGLIFLTLIYAKIFYSE